MVLFNSNNIKKQNKKKNTEANTSLVYNDLGVFLFFFLCEKHSVKIIACFHCDLYFWTVGSIFDIFPAF